MAKVKEISDFGEKIGGARKDIAQLRKLGGFDVDDISEWSDIERDKHITKKEVFVKPDYQAMLDSGDYSREALYFQQKMYKALPVKPYLYKFIIEATEQGKSESDGIHAGQEAYITFMNQMRKALSEVKTTKDILSFGSKVRQLQEEQPDIFKSLDYDDTRKINRNLVNSSYALSVMNFKINQSKFLYSEDEKKLADTTILQYDGKNIYKEFYINAKVEGVVPLNGRTMQEVTDQTHTGTLRECQFRQEGDNLIVVGKLTSHQSSKSEESLPKDLAVWLANSENNVNYRPLGDVKSPIVKSVEIDEAFERTRFAFKTGSGTHYLYNQDSALADIEKYEVGKYVVMTDRNVLGINYDSLESAKKAAIEIITLRDSTLAESKKALREGKTKLIPPQLAHIHRVGEDYLDGKDVEVRQKLDSNGKFVVKTNEKGEQTPAMECPAFETELGFRAGEFGNWENQDDRRVNLKMAYESFRDMTKALGISENDTSLGGNLAIAFGSRGRGGNAVAHFEPASNVINITKMRGAGSLGHEWGHALDYAIARAENKTIKNGKGWYETDSAKSKDSVLHNVMKAMKETPDGSRTDYLKDAIYIDSRHSKSDKGYWQSDVELFARAFHNYLLDKLKEQGIRNDYLCGHAQYAPTMDKDNNAHYTYPRGEERERINQAFDKLIENLKEKGFFHEHGIDKSHQLVHSQDGIEQSETKEQTQGMLIGQLELDVSEPEQKTVKESTVEQEETQPSQSDNKTQGEEKASASEVAPSPTYGTANDADSLQVGDIIKLSGESVVDRSFKTVQLSPEYARVTEVNEQAVSFVTSPDDPTVPDKWDNGRETYLTTGDEHWSEKLAKRGFEVISIQPEQSLTSTFTNERSEKPLTEDMQKGTDKSMAKENNVWGTPQQAQKKSFSISPSLKSLENAMKEQQPFAVMAMSTTGTDKDSEPIRTVVQEYVFNDELKRYEKGLTFDEMVKCSQEQLDKMLTDKTYDYFGNSGIDKNAYIRGEGILSKEEFSKEFISFMQALEQDNKELLIINGGAVFAQQQLAHISPEAQQIIANKATDRTAISQTSLTSEYFKRHDIHKKVTLENLRDEILPSPSGSFRDMLMEGSPRMQDFQKMSKEKFCKSANVTSYQYDATVKDIENHNAKIIGADAKVELIAYFTKVDGRERGIFESERNSQWREADVLDKQQLSENGKVKYQNADYKRKLETLVASRVVDPETVLDRNSDCDLNRLLNIMEKKGADRNGHNKGFVVIQAATTGFDNRGVGEPIQVSAIAFELEDNGSITPKDGISEYGIKASERTVTAAIDKANKGGFDAFGYADIDVDKYRSGEGVHSKEEAMRKLSAFFKEYPSEDYPIISNGGGRNEPSLTTTQEALLSLGSIKAFNDSLNSVDFTQAIKEYSYAAYHGECVESVIANEDNLKSFGLAEIVAANNELANVLRQTQAEGKTIIGSTLQKVNATAMLADAIRMQDMELHRPKLFATLTQEEQMVQEEPTAPTTHDSDRKQAEQSNTIPVVSAYDENDGFEMDSDYTGYNNAVDIADILDNPEVVMSVPSEDTREHGNLYSDKKGDTRDIVIVEGNVKKVAEVEIPHVGAAPMGEQNKQTKESKEEPNRRMADRQLERRRKREDSTKDYSSRTSVTSIENSATQTSDRETELWEIIKSQQEMMKSMQEEIAKKDQLLQGKENTINLIVKQLTTAIDKQTDLMAQIAGVSREEPSKDYTSMSSSERADFIEHLKDEIVKLKEAVPSGNRESLALSNANMQLSNAQKYMEREQRIPNKAG